MLECDICYNPYGSNLREPKILARCGHTICSDCIESLRRTADHRFYEIQCPHCRVVTPVKEIRTNFAISAAIDTPSDQTKISNEPFCESHAISPVSLFCVICQVFICPQCYEIEGAPHATHSRVSLADGIDVVKRRNSEIVARVEALMCINSELLTRETQEVSQGIQKLEAMGQGAIEHYHRQVKSLSEQLDAALTVLGRYKASLDKRIEPLVRRQNVLDNIRRGLATKPRTVSEANATLVTRETVTRALIESDSNMCVIDSLDQISIGNSRPDASHSELVLPIVLLNDVASSGHIHIEDPQKPRMAPSKPQMQTRGLHRTTSNDHLSC